MKLTELLQAVQVIDFLNEKDLTISGIAYHSQKVTEGNLFVCVKGYETDGHRYLPQAISSGAVAAVVEDVQEGLDIPQIVVENSRIALARLADHYYGNPSKQMTMIGITATNGKTTTSYMVDRILQEEGYKTGLVGTVAIKMGNEAIPSVLTTPESLDLQYYLSQMVERDISHACMEVSSNALESHRVETVDYDIVAFNNVGHDHIDFHGSFENYFNVKKRLITEARPHTFAVLNLDDPIVSKLADETKATVITFGMDNLNAHLSCSNIDLSTGRATFTVEVLKPIQRFPFDIQPCQFEMKLAVPGLHSVYNAMSAIAVGLLSGASIESIQAAMAKFGGVERRFEFIYEDDDIKIIDDHFANGGNIDVTLNTLQMMKYNKLHLVYAIRGGRGTTVNRENAETVVKWAKQLDLHEIIATKSVSHVKRKDVVTDEETEVLLTVLSKANIKVHLYDELKDAIAKGFESVNRDDVILLAGAQGMDFGAEIALDLLKERNPFIPEENLYAPLISRVAGVTPERREQLIKYQ